MKSLWIRVTGCQFGERLEQSTEDHLIAHALSGVHDTLGQSRAADMFSRFRDQTWLTLSATRLNLPGARIADAFGPQRGWTAYGDRVVIDAIDRPLPAGERNTLA